MARLFSQISRIQSTAQKNAACGSPDRYLAGATERLRNFVGKLGQATLSGDTFDDAATGQGLLNFFLRGLNCGAITEAEAQATGLSLAELRTRSFLKILEGRRR